MQINDNQFNLLNSISSPLDVKRLSTDELITLCDEIRKELINTVSNCGGHLASNLGVVELTVAVHKIFDSPKDQIVWDVGHQCYTHKLLTGRKGRFNTLRQEGGLSGFPKSSESEHDSFLAGHSSTSISAALGLLKAKSINNNNSHVIAIIGDGSFTGGLAYEGLNNAGRSKENIVVILNDNTMSISKNVGAIARYFTKMRSQPSYFKAKDIIERIIVRIPFFGRRLRLAIIKSKSAIKHLIYKTTFFEELGFTYLGPVDGHNIKSVCEILERAKTINKPVLVHVITVKGKGYTHAENSPTDFHGVKNFDVETGESEQAGNCFSDVFGRSLVSLAETDKRICAVTAAMKVGTGLSEFAQGYKDRFFDVGIAEGHALTFCAGLSANGMVPVFAVYSSFLQRAYDQIIHDCAIENRKIILAIDRAGIVGEDGETHQGLFDVSFLSSIPNVTIFAPSTYKELENALYRAIYDTNGIVAIRYPRGAEDQEIKNTSEKFNDYEFFENNSSLLVVTYGRTFVNVFKATKEVNIPIDILKLNNLTNLNDELIEKIKNYQTVFFVEEGVRTGGVSERLLSNLCIAGFKGDAFIRAIDNPFVGQATVKKSIENVGLDVGSISSFLMRGKN